jgi:hypothetical protein
MSIPIKNPLKRAIEKAELRPGLSVDEYVMRIVIAKWWLEEYKSQCRKEWLEELEKQRAKDGYFYA